MLIMPFFIREGLHSTSTHSAWVRHIASWRLSKRGQHVRRGRTEWEELSVSSPKDSSEVARSVHLTNIVVVPECYLYQVNQGILPKV